MSDATPSPSERTYPLSWLFIVLTVVAVKAALVRPLLRNGWDKFAESPPTVIGICLLCMVIGAMFGAIVGLFQFHRTAGVLCGMVVGAAIGPLAGLMLTADLESMKSLITAVLVGCVLILFVAWFTRPPVRKDDADIYEAKLAQPVSQPPPRSTNPFAD